MTNLAALSTALDSLFTDPPAAEAGGRAYGAPRAGIKGGREWARLVKGAIKDRGSLGSFQLDLNDARRICVSKDGGDRVLLMLDADVLAGFDGGFELPPIRGVALSADNGESVPVQIATGAFWANCGATKQWGAAVNLLREAICGALSREGYTLGDKTLRAQSPTDITLSLEGDTVVATFQPPLRASWMKLTRNVSRVEATETLLHVIVDGFLGVDAWFDLEE